MIHPSGVWCIIAIVMGAATPAHAQTASGEVRIGDRAVFTIRAPLGTISPAERAAIVSDRLQRILDDPAITPEKIIVEDHKVIAIVKANDFPLLEVTSADADSASSQPSALAEEWAMLIRQSFRMNRSRTFETRLLGKMLLGLLYPIGLIVAFRVTRGLFKRATNHVLHSDTPRLQTLHLKGVKVLSARRLRVGIAYSLGFAKYVIYGLIGYIFIVLMFSNFPQTQAYSWLMLEYLTAPLMTFAVGLIQNLPRIGAMLLVILGVRFTFKLTGAFADQVRTGKLTLEPFLASDMAWVGASIVKACILFTALLVIALMFPDEGRYLVLAVLALAAIAVISAVIPAASNIAAGFMITYMRLFKIRDVVTIARFTGYVVEKTLLYTKLADEKGDEIIIPNRQILNNVVVNSGFSTVRSFRLYLTTPRETAPGPMESVVRQAIAATPGVGPITQEGLHARTDDETTVWEARIPLLDATQAHQTKAALYRRIMESCGETGINLQRIDIEEQSQG